MRCSSVRSSVVPSCAAAAACGGFAAVGEAGGKYRPTAAGAAEHGQQHGAQQQMRAMLR